MAHAQRPGTFDPLLPVRIDLPFPGDYGKLTAVFSMMAVMDLAHKTSPITQEDKPLARREEDINDALEDNAVETAAALQEAPTAAARRALLRAQQDQTDALHAERSQIQEQRRALRRAWNIERIGEMIIALEGPDGLTLDPTDPATFTAWPDMVLNWLGGELALAEVQKRLIDPLLPSGSPAT